ncbi:MAG TPA: hypothetical protein PLX69_00905 [Leptospiraceae bacterium]|nr:hypothetical protein [Leptospiraceae bacterium]
MNKRFLFLLTVFISFNLFIYVSNAAWFIYFNKTYLYILSGICVSLQVAYIFYAKASESRNNLLQSRVKIPIAFSYILLFISVSLMIFFPVRNLNLGDGILLLEHVALEAKMFGYHLTMDEVFEAFVHSILFAKFPSLFATPMEVYRIVSTISGLCAMGILVYYFRKFKVSFIGYFLVLSCGGIYLFHGYSENYTMITTGLWFYILYSVNSIRSNQSRNMQALLPICVIACLLILSHLVSGYLLFSLIFLCYHFSDEGKFLQNALYSTIFSLLILLPVFGYFTFFSNVRFDFTQTHLTNPKFYPIAKMISINHFRDILFCIVGSAFLPFVVLLYLLLFKKEQTIQILKRKEFQFLIFVLIGFLIHGFVHYPQLGFPADWDLLAFFWSPIVFITVLMLEEFPKINEARFKGSQNSFPLELIPIFLFAGIIFVLNAVILSKPDEKKMIELRESLLIIDRFSYSEEATVLGGVKPEFKKFYLKVSFFLFESGIKIKGLNLHSESKVARLLNENKQFQLELKEHIGNIETKWQKDFYARLTRYHLEYLDITKEK